MRLIGLATILTLSLTIAPLAAEAQQPGKVYRIGVIFTAMSAASLDAFRQRLRELGMTGLMELVALAGQYRLIAGVLFAFDTPLPEGTPAPF